MAAASVWASGLIECRLHTDSVSSPEGPQIRATAKSRCDVFPGEDVCRMMDPKKNGLFRLDRAEFVPR